MNYDPPRKYDMEARAKALAVADWRGKVGRQCSGASSDWAKAKNKKLECEGYAGGLMCSARGIPGDR